MEEILSISTINQFRLYSDMKQLVTLKQKKHVRLCDVLSNNNELTKKKETYIYTFYTLLTGDRQEQRVK